MPRIVCSAATTGASVVYSGSNASICAVSRSHRASAPFDRRDVVLEQDVMHRLLKLERRERAAMQVGPGRSPIRAALAQQKP
jgi:hypothetical protein